MTERTQFGDLHQTGLEPAEKPELTQETKFRNEPGSDGLCFFSPLSRNRGLVICGELNGAARTLI
jgi:hypothetical protein